MRSFENLASKDWVNIAQQRRSETLSVKKVTTGLTSFHSAAQSVGKSGYVEYPPTTVALTDKGAAELLVGLGHDVRGHWDRFTILVYREGGKIYFRESDPTTLEAKIEF